MTKDGTVPPFGKMLLRLSLPSTCPQRHTKSHCFLLRSSYAPLKLARDHTGFYFLARERLEDPEPKMTALRRTSPPRCGSMLSTGRSRALRSVVKESLDRVARCPFGAEPGLALDPPKLAEQLAVRVAGTRALDLRSHDPVVAFTLDRCGAKRRDQEAAERRVNSS